jgi:hypothetical protein
MTDGPRSFARTKDFRFVHLMIVPSILPEDISEGPADTFRVSSTQRLRRPRGAGPYARRRENSEIMEKAGHLRGKVCVRRGTSGASAGAGFVVPSSVLANDDLVFEGPRSRPYHPAER